jgi:ABC-type phosphate transport system permease subunit
MSTPSEIIRSPRPVWFQLWERVQFVVLAGSALAVILPIVAIFWFLIQKGGSAISWDFISKAPEQFMKAGGIMPALVGTLWLIAGTFLFALPLGLLGAVYITEYGRHAKFTRVLRLAIVNLAGVPSVVYGLFGLGFFVLTVGAGIDRSFFHSPFLTAKDFKDPASIRTRLETKATPLDAYLAEKTSPSTWEVLRAYDDEVTDQDADQIQIERVGSLLAQDWNPLLQLPDFYSAERFAGVALTPDLQKRAEAKPTEPNLGAKTNRQVLEEALEGEIGGHQRLVFGTGAIMWASLTLALLILPVVITAAEEALLSVPDSFRQASLALGCTRWQTVKNIVLPSALPGILTGMILGISRAAGETAPILLVGASFFLPSLPHAPNDPFMALPYHLFIVSTQVPDMPERIQWGTALVLFLLVFGMNTFASIFRARARAGRKW